jgi:hypothetical protein
VTTSRSQAPPLEADGLECTGESIIDLSFITHDPRSERSRNSDMGRHSLIVQCPAQSAQTPETPEFPQTRGTQKTGKAGCPPPLLRGVRHFFRTANLAAASR